MVDFSDRFMLMELPGSSFVSISILDEVFTMARSFTNTLEISV